MKFSPSKIKKFMECSLQASYVYIDGLQERSLGSSAHFGTAVHAGLEAYHNGESVEQAVKIFQDHYKSIEPDYYNNRTSYTQHMDLGPKMIREYHETFKWSTHKLLGAEKRFMVPFGKHLLSGIVDILYTDNEDNLYLVDLKTGKKPTLESLYLDVQFTSYDYASRQKEFWCGMKSDDPDWLDKYSGWENGEELYERFKNSERINIWYDLKSNKAVNVGDRKDFDYQRLYRVCEMIDRAVETKTFVPTISAATCNWCDFKDRCPIWIDPPEKNNG